MSKAKTYLFHEISSYLPLLEGKEFDDLVEDMKLFGQIEPAVLYEGKILDGRNRYRACQILKIELMVKEWKPSEAIGSTPLQYVISENIMRRHLNEAQKGQIGMLLYPEIESQVEEERTKKMSETKKEQFKKGEIKTLGIGKGTTKVSGKVPTVVRDYKEEEKSTTAYKVAQKVRVKPHTITKVKKITDVAKTDKKIAENWEQAKRGDSSIDAVYKEVRKKEAIEEIEKISPAVAKELKEEKPVITIKEAKAIAEIPNESLRKKEIAERVIVKKRQESEIEKKKDLAEGKILPKPKYFDKDASKVKSIEEICKKAVNELTFAGLEGYGKIARDVCIEMMKMLFEHLREELKKAGEVAPAKVIDTNVY